MDRSRGGARRDAQTLVVTGVDLALKHRRGHGYWRRDQQRDACYEGPRHDVTTECARARASTRVDSAGGSILPEDLVDGQLGFVGSGAIRREQVLKLDVGVAGARLVRNEE